MDVDPQRIAELIGEVAREVQRRLVAELAKEPAPTTSVDEPRGFLDLAPYADLTPRQVAATLDPAGHFGHRDWIADAVERERSGYDDAKIATAGRLRCEAGRASKAYLRCLRPALPGERWCKPHHPAAPASPIGPVYKRLSAEALAMRPDGRVFQELYLIGDRLQAIEQALEAASDREARISALVEERAPVQWLTTQEAAAYARCLPSRISWAAKRGQLRGTRRTAGGRWNFQRADLDAWLEGRSAEVRPRAPRPRPSRG
jgi:excisionase family DNA binding protein